MYYLTQASSYHLPSPSPDSPTYILSLARTPASRLAAISSDQAFSLLDSATLNPLRSFVTHHGNLTTLEVLGGEGDVVCTAGENGSVAVWDLRTGEAVAQFQGTTAPIISMACSPSLHTITLGTELHNHTATISIYDIRSAPNPIKSYSDFHSDDITTLAHHPATPALLLSGSVDGLVSLHDTRVADEDEATLQTLNLGASVHKAAFLGSSGAVAGLSHDEKFAVYDVSEERNSGDAVVDFGDLRQRIGCRYVCDVVPKMNSTGAILGAGSQDREEFRLFFLTGSGDSWALDEKNGVVLPGAHGEDIVRAFCFFDEDQVVFTGGEDGCIRAWRPGS